MMKRIICFFLGHDLELSTYYVLCKRCKMLKRRSDYDEFED